MSIQKIFGFDCQISPLGLEWKPTEQLYEGIASPHVQIAVGVPGIDGQVHLILSRHDVEAALARALHVDPILLLNEDPSFFDRFSAFFSLELVACARGLDSLKPLSIQLCSRQELSGAGCLCQDIEVLIEGQRSLARLLVPQHFLTAWRTFRLGNEVSSRLPDVDVQIHVEAGRTSLSPKTLTEVQVGDFLIVDHPFYIPGSKRARVYLTYGGQPLYRAKIEDGSIRILEMPTQHEAFLPVGGFSMTTPDSSEQHEEDLDIQSNPFSDEDATKEEEEGASEPDTSSIPGSVPGSSMTALKEPFKIGDVPLSVVVQLAELTMSVDKLAALQPGNLLDLDVRPENGVTLVVNNRIVGRGELILIGESVGVRIKEMGTEAGTPATPPTAQG